MSNPSNNNENLMSNLSFSYSYIDKLISDKDINYNKNKHKTNQIISHPKLKKLIINICLNNSNSLFYFKNDRRKIT